MRCAILAFLIGAGWLQTIAALPKPSTILAAVLIAMLLYALRRRIPALLASALLGAAWAAFSAMLALADALPREQEGRDVVVVGTVDSLPHAFEGGTRFNFRVEQVLTPGATVPARVALSWYGRMARQAGAVQVEPGERWRLVVRLQRPHGNANPHVGES